MNAKTARMIANNAAKRIDITAGDVATFHGQLVRVLERISPKRAEVMFEDGSKLTVYVTNLTRVN